MSQSPEHRAKIAAAMQDTWRDPAYRKSRAETQRILREMWAEPETRQRMEQDKAFVPAELKRRRKALRLAEEQALRDRLATLEAENAELRRQLQ